jgi:aspartate aminotransferase-like enzyme
MRLHTPGPVPIAAHIRAIGAQQVPYNRTKEFSDFTHEIVTGLKHVFQTEGQVALVTGSGTAAMEAAVLNFLGATDRALIINGGTFGQRWCDLCELHSVPYDEYLIPLGTDIDLAHLGELLSTNRSTALLVNAHETSTGHLYDIPSLGALARSREVFFLVDAISSICADPFSMDDWQVDAAVLSTQKALALPPGMAFVAMNSRAVSRLTAQKPSSLYFNLSKCLSNQLRGQTTYTPAIGLMLQLHQRLRDILEQSLPALIRQHQLRAESFRRSLAGLPYQVFPARSSNAITALSCAAHDASQVVEMLRLHHNIIAAPNTGQLESKVFRVAHMGDHEHYDSTYLTEALRSIAFSNARKN